MTDKAYIVTNEQQEREVLEKLEREGYLWRGTDMRPTEKYRLTDEPITIFARDDKRLTFNYRVNEEYLTDYEIEIDFDGRKEEHMSEKYVVSQEVMNELEKWKDTLSTYDEPGCFIDDETIKLFPYVVTTWWVDNRVPDKENNNRLIAILRWVNGEDVFEIEKSKKWVVRSKECTEQGRYLYVYSIGRNGIKDVMTSWTKNTATHFDTKEEAESWANAHQEVVEVEE